VVTFPAEERHCPPASTKCLVTEAHRCGQLAEGCYAALSVCESNPRPIDCKSNALLLLDGATCAVTAVDSACLCDSLILGQNSCRKTRERSSKKSLKTIERNLTVPRRSALLHIVTEICHHHHYYFHHQSSLTALTSWDLCLHLKPLKAANLSK